MDGQDRLAGSWETNAGAWIRAVRDQRIPSRVLGTDAAIVDAVLDRRPHRVLDLGCGEGWLTRTFSDHGIEAVGVDASAELIASARQAGGAEYYECSYTELTDSPQAVGSHFDVIVCNFSLLHEDVGPLLDAVRTLLGTGGSLIIQTVHPWTSIGTAYDDHWRTETFENLDDEFEPMPWYFRTLESWTQLLAGCGYCLRDLREPRHPESDEPLSLIIIAENRASSVR